jgi:hypothetical protein
MELNFIELPKFTKKEEDCQSLADKWIYFIKNAEDLRVIPENIEVEEIKLAYETVTIWLDRRRTSIIRSKKPFCSLINGRLRNCNF